jgi:transcriptional regulator with XRE-family HTH domain
VDTEGRDALKTALETMPGGQSAIGRALGIHQSSVSGWVHGTSRPEPHLRTALKILLGIDEEKWLTNEERAAIERVRELPKLATGTEG